MFERFAGVYHLHVGGQLIRTTAEHPFYAAGKGWTAAFELLPGDGVMTADGTWVRVEEVTDTGETVAVYNLRVSNHHTYFVGRDEWGWSAWAHNLCLLATEKGFLQSSPNRYVSKDKSKIVKTQGEAYKASSFDQAKREVKTILGLWNKLYVQLNIAGKPSGKVFSSEMVDGLFTTYGNYFGEFEKYVSKADDEDTEKARTEGTDGIFFALTGVKVELNNPNRRPQLDWVEATAVFKAMGWKAPKEPEFDDLVPLKPGQVAGYDLPDPQQVHPRYKSTRADHRNGALYEQLLAYQVHGGTFGNGEIVVWWGGAKIGAKGSADVISVHMTTGKVTLWDSKYRTQPGGAIESETFTEPTRSKPAREQAIAVIQNLPTARQSAELQQNAILSLRDKTYHQKTVRHKSGSFTPGSPKSSAIPIGG